MKKWKKMMSLVTLGVIVSVGLVGCATANKEEKGAASDEITIRFAWWGNDDRHKATLEMIEAFEEKYPEISVKAEYSGYDGYDEKLTTQIAGGTEPDLIQLGFDSYLKYSPEGTGFYDLNTLTDWIDLSGYSDEMMDHGVIEGKLNGITFNEGATALFINQSTFEKFDVEVPTTWEGYIEAASHFDEGYYPFVDKGFNIINIYLSQKYGKPLLDEEGNVNYTEEQLREGFEWRQMLIDKKVIPSQKQVIENIGSNSLSTVKQFIEGEYAGTTEWVSSMQSFYQILEESDQKLILPDFPKMENAVTTGIMKQPNQLFSISKNTKYPEETAKLLNFMLNEKEGVVALGTTRGVPGNTKAIAFLDEEGILTDIAKQGADYIENTEGLSNSPYYNQPQVAAILNDTMEQLGLGTIDAKEAAKMMLEQLTDAIADIKNNY